MKTKLSVEEFNSHEIGVLEFNIINPKFNLVINDNKGNELIKLVETDDGKIDLETDNIDNISEAAKLFFENVIEHNNSYIKRLKDANI